MKLWNRNFVMVLLGQIISLFGNAVLRFALPLYLLNQSGSAALFGLVSASAFIPMILLMPIGGILADRVNKRNIMVILDFATVLLTISYTLALGRVSLTVLTCVALILLYGIQGIYQPAVQASIPLLVPAGSIMQGNAMVNLVSSVSGLIGPVIGGAIFGFVGIEPILWVSICCFSASAVMEIFILIPFQKRERQDTLLAEGLSDYKESVDFIMDKRPEILHISLIIAAVNLVLSGCVMIGLPIVVTKDLGFTVALANQLYGYAEGAMGAGSLVGGLLAGILANKVKLSHSPWLIFAAGATLLATVAALSLPHMSQMVSYALILIGAFLMMVTAAFFSIQMMSYLQILKPTELLGKVISCAMCIGMCASPIGQALYGILFQKVSDLPQLIFAGAFAAMTLVSIVSVRSFKNLDTILKSEYFSKQAEASPAKGETFQSA